MFHTAGIWLLFIVLCVALCAAAFAIETYVLGVFDKKRRMARGQTQ